MPNPKISATAKDTSAPGRLFKHTACDSDVSRFQAGVGAPVQTIIAGMGQPMNEFNPRAESADDG